MSKGNKFSYAALGLIAGVTLCITFAYFAFPWFSDPSYQQVVYIDTNGERWKEHQQESKPISGRFFTTQDSVAQWAMAIIAFFATGVSIWAVKLVRDTLDATRDGVLETRRIGEAQVRAYFSFGQLQYGLDQNEIRGLFSVTNTGQTPAFGIKFIIRLKPGIEIDVYTNPLTQELGLIAAGQERKMSFVFHGGFDSSFEAAIRHGIKFSIIIDVEWTDVFGRVQYINCNYFWDTEYLFNKIKGKMLNTGQLAPISISYSNVDRKKLSKSDNA